ncbi:lysophospholipid acyltransferase family protein [Silvimonas iriomotensis]|uniref:Lipid A biosynthesis lauroyl acyltransferase n=1 Tax=Silvimonas iriomotensis TaxID=449662 RepID=A0ABQ2PEI2_9NEIS|nr:lysophospholipid acyltransferase family protein [Silvimonas iriomotensis]GGP23580.1 lipid A biosynthesis lauroyl acyltransferase [Silvimonas iriomotensis]
MLVRLLRPLAYTPLCILQAIGAGLGWIAWWTSPTYRRRLADNSKRAAQYDTTLDYIRLRRSSIVEHGKGAVELLAAWLRTVPDVAAMVKEVKGREHLEAALARPEPIIFVSPHLGAIEVCGVYLAHEMPRALAALYRPPKLKWLEPLMLASRDRANGRAAPANAQGVRMLLKTLKEGQAVYILPDQAPGGGEGAWAPFFGHRAYTMTLLSRLARSSKATVLFCFAERRPCGRGYVMHIEPMQGSFTGDPLADATTLNHNLEGLILKAPSQYLWSYNRYKTPAGAPAPESE